MSQVVILLFRLSDILLSFVQSQVFSVQFIRTWWCWAFSPGWLFLFNISLSIGETLSCTALNYPITPACTMEQLWRKTCQILSIDAELCAMQISLRCVSQTTRLYTSPWSAFSMIYIYFFLFGEELVTIWGKYRILLYYQFVVSRGSVTAHHVLPGSGGGSGPIVNIFSSPPELAGNGTASTRVRSWWD